VLHKAWHRNSWRFENNSRFGGPHSQLQWIFLRLPLRVWFSSLLLSCSLARETDEFLYLSLCASIRRANRSLAQATVPLSWRGAELAQSFCTTWPGLGPPFHQALRFRSYLPYVFSHSSTSRSILGEAEAAKHSFQHSLPHLSQPFMPWLPTITTAIHTPTTSTSR